MTCFPNAKINIGLNVTGLRSDGYHNLETVFYPVPLFDELTVAAGELAIGHCATAEAGSGFVLHSGGVPLNCPAEKNLVIKVLRNLREDFRIGDVHIYLYKRIPDGAGLGGGSSDAAFMMKALNRLFGLDLSDEEMEKRLSDIGADCAFFVRNKPVFAEGIGNVFSPVSLSLSGLHLAIVKPRASVSTPKAYSLVRPKKPEHRIIDILKEPVESWKAELRNDFEEGVFAMFPEIARVKAELCRMGASYAAMSGSGAAVFGLFRTQPADGMLRSVFPDCFVWECCLP